MVKILHTADIHLKLEKDERWEALHEIIDIGREEGIDILVISGDFFDGTVDIERLRPELRKILSQAGFKTVIIPGNHDERLRKNIHLGENVHVLSRKPVDYYNYKDVRLIGIPFKRMSSEEVFKILRSLSNKLEADKSNILLFHGELADKYFHIEDFGNECDRRYMPLKLSYLRGLNIDYVLAGHYHKCFKVWPLENGGFFVYPGSPVSITKKEVGQRKINLLEVGDLPKERSLDTFHYEERDIKLSPLEESNPIEYIKNTINSIHPKAWIFLRIGGFIDSNTTGITEDELRNYVENILRGRGECELYFRDIDIISQDDLFKRFKEKLMEIDCSEEEKELMLEMLIESFIEVMS